MFEPKAQRYGLAVIAGETMPAQALQRPFHGEAQGAEQNDNDRFDPLKILWFAFHYRWVIATLLTASLVAGTLLTWMQTPLYRASANIELLTQGAKVMEELKIVSQTSDIRAFETARLRMLSRDLARRVVYTLDLSSDDTFLAPTPRFSLGNLVGRVTGIRRQAVIADKSAEEREALAVERIQEELSVTLVRNTNVLTVSYTHPLPELAAKVANEVARSFIDQGVDKRGETSELARQFIEERVRETKQKLQVSEQALVDYAKDAGITLTGDDASLISGNMGDINEGLAEAIKDRLGAERYLQQVKEGNANALPQVFDSPSIQATKEKLAELKAQYQEKLSTLKPGFPEMRRLQAQIGELQNQIKAEVGAIARSVEIAYEQAVAKEEALRRELAGLEMRQAEFQDKNIKYTILKREVDSNRTQYETLVTKLNEVGVGAEIKDANASIIDEALPPKHAFSPRLSTNLLIALFLSITLAAAVIYLLELMNNTFAVPDQIESELKLPVLGIIPRHEAGTIMEAFKEPRSAVSEAYRSLRTSLQFAGAESSMRTLVVTSASPSEGKSTTVYKLATDFAALGKRVLVIDADLRRPRLHRLFNTDNAIGLSNLLSNVVRQGDVATIFRDTADANLTFMSAGTIPPNPADLLTSQKMAMTLHFCTRKYDLVIIDSPPVMGLSDAPILSRQADATLIAVSSKQVTRKAAKNALDRLKAAGGNVVGAALTKFAVDQLDYNYAYRYMQYNYHSYEGEIAKIEHDQKPGPSRLAGRLGGIVSALLGRRGSSDGKYGKHGA